MTNTRKNLGITLVVMLLCIATWTTSTAAQAQNEPDARPAAGDRVALSTYYGADRVCRKARRIDQRPGRCASERRSSLRKKRWKPGRTYLAQYGDVRPLDGHGPTLREAVEDRSRCCSPPPPTYCKGWKQTLRGIYYINWKEVHVGDFCYNQDDVWVTMHRCDLGYGIAYDIVPRECSENKLHVDTRPGYGYQNWDIFRVHVAWKGIPIWKAYQMHVNVYPSGNFYGY